MLMMRPQRAFIMALTNACVSRNMPVRFVCMTSSQSLRFMRSSSVSRVMPALFTRICTGPRRPSASLATVLIDSSLLTSSTKISAVPPTAAISAATSCSLASFRAARPTRAPALASASAQARPMPCEAPVTNAFFPSRVPAIGAIFLWPIIEGAQTFLLRPGRRGATA